MNEFKEMFPNLEPNLIATTLEKNDGNSERTLNELLSAVWNKIKTYDSSPIDSFYFLVTGLEKTVQNFWNRIPRCMINASVWNNQNQLERKTGNFLPHHLTKTNDLNHMICTSDIASARWISENMILFFYLNCEYSTNFIIIIILLYQNIYIK